MGELGVGCHRLLSEGRFGIKQVVVVIFGEEILRLGNFFLLFILKVVYGLSRRLLVIVLKLAKQ